MTDEDKEVCNIVSERIYNRHRIKITPDKIFEYFKLYVEYIIWNFNHAKCVRLPYIGTFVLKERKWQRYVFIHMMRSKGTSEVFIKQCLDNKNWWLYLDQIKEYDKVFRNEWKGTDFEQAGDSTI